MKSEQINEMSMTNPNTKLMLDYGAGCGLI